jgi:tetratricopeptide (TPR) repeat protein
MLFNVVPVLLIFAAVAVIVTVVARRLPEIAAINTETIPEARAAEVKRQLLIERLQRKLKALLAVAWAKTASSRQAVRTTAARLYATLAALEERYRRPISAAPTASRTPTPADPVGRLLAEAAQAREAGQRDEAERRYLEVIRLDRRNVSAYRGLGRLYSEQGQYGEAREALAFALRLQEEASTYDALGEICRQAGDITAALDAWQAAVKLEPTNADYLDRLLEVAILGEHKRLATSTLSRLSAVDPDRASLGELRARVAALPVRRGRPAAGSGR